MVDVDELPPSLVNVASRDHLMTTILHVYYEVDDNVGDADVLRFVCNGVPSLTMLAYGAGLLNSVSPFELT